MLRINGYLNWQFPVAIDKPIIYIYINILISIEFVVGGSGAGLFVAVIVVERDECRGLYVGTNITDSFDMFR